MDGATLSRFPHLSWLGANLSLRPGPGPWCVNWQANCHSLALTLDNPYSVRWIHRGHETHWTSTRGTVHFLPCDQRHHVLLTHADEPCDFFLVFVPAKHISQIAQAEGFKCAEEMRRLLLPQDAVLRQALLTLSSCIPSSNDDLGRADAAARRLILRIVELNGGGTPDWHDDASVFDHRTLRQSVEYIDAHLQIAPSLSELGMRVGLSPSHYAKKFRQSTGLSLHRFVNRRRILAAMESLKKQAEPVAHVALDLGFSSQAHFTHVFSSLTGMTPAKYRKQFRRVVG